MWLSEQSFHTVIESTPLVSIDLIVENSEGSILLGKRLNRPAKDFWFVPGGRILKGETLDDAFVRLTRTELGCDIERSAARLLGVYEHFYDDSAVNENLKTHYVVLGYSMSIGDLAIQRLPREQHNDYAWWSPADLIASPEVHRFTKDYLSALGNT